MRVASALAVAALLAASAGPGNAHEQGKKGSKPGGGTGLGQVLDKTFGKQFEDVEKRVAEMREEFRRLDEIAQRDRLENGEREDRRSRSHRLAQEFLDRAVERMKDARRDADAGDAEGTSTSLVEAAGSIYQAKANADMAWRELGYDPATQEPLRSAPPPAAPPTALEETKAAPPAEPAPPPSPEPQATPLAGVPRIPKTPAASKRAALVPQAPVPAPGGLAAARPALQGESAPAWLAAASQAQSASVAPAEAARVRSGRPGAAPGRPAAVAAPAADSPPERAGPPRAAFRDSGVRPAVEAARESLGLAEEALRRGDYAAAESHARAAAAADPSNSRAFELMSWAQLKQRKWKDALSSAKKAAELSPGEARPRFLAALAHEKLGERRAALLEVAEAARLDPRYQAAHARALAGRDLGDETMEDELFLTDMLAQAGRGGAGPFGWLLLLALGSAAAAVAARAWLRGRAPAADEAAAAPAPAEEKFELARLLGRRDGTEVWQAKDRVLGREVAVVRRKAPMGDAARTAFVQQARRAAALRHPALIELYEVLERADEVWLVYEALRGVTLAQCLQQEGRLPLARAIEFLDPVCRALEYAHGRGMFHGALGPAAIVLAEGGFVKLRELGGAPGADRASDVRGLAACLEAMVGPDASPPFRELAAAASAAEFLRRVRAAASSGSASR